MFILFMIRLQINIRENRRCKQEWDHPETQNEDKIYSILPLFCLNGLLRAQQHTMIKWGVGVINFNELNSSFQKCYGRHHKLLESQRKPMSYYFVDKDRFLLLELGLNNHRHKWPSISYHFRVFRLALEFFGVHVVSIFFLFFLFNIFNSTLILCIQRVTFLELFGSYRFNNSSKTSFEENIIIQLKCFVDSIQYNFFHIRSKDDTMNSST